MSTWSGRALRAVAISAACMAAAAPGVFAQEPALNWDNYDPVTITTDVADPIDLAVMPDRRVLHTARGGALRLTDPATGTTKVVNTFDVYTNGEQGLQTVTLDPDFATNRWVYLWYAPTKMEAPYPEQVPDGNAPSTLPAGETEAYWNRWKGYMLLSRFKWDPAADRLDVATEQKIIKVDYDRGGGNHVAGDVAWDAEGNLYLSTGDNTGAGAGGASGYAPINDSPGQSPFNDARRGPANTNDLRGKILRVKVQPDGSYTIPSGNLFAPGTMGARPEIYIMGLRNPFRMNIDQKSGTIVWGDYGPDAGRDDPLRGPMGLVEWNAAPTSGGAHNSGWPFCVGDNLKPYNNWNFVTQTPREFFNCGALKNTSRNNTGLVDLPPARPATVWYGDRNCRTLAPADCDNPAYPELTSFAENIEQAPMAGPVYNFDASNPSTTKFPAYWDGKAFFGEYSQDYLAAFTFNKPNGPITKIENFFPNGELGARGYPLWDGPIDLEFGPEGSLYVVNYSGTARSIVRVDYSPGNKRPRASISVDRASGGAAPLAVEFDASGSSDADGDTLTYQWDFDGNGTWDATGATASYTYTANGLYTARLQATDPGGKAGIVSRVISVGNTAPTVTLTTPPAGGFVDWGRATVFQIQVSDPEDTGEIACSRVRWTISLGHSTHAHPFTTGQGCKVGVPIYPDGAEHGETENVYTVLEVSYTDAGANGVAGATGSTRVILNPKLMQAEHADASQGITTVEDNTASGKGAVTSFDTGDWIAYDPVNLLNINSVTTRASGSGQLALRWGSATATPFATVNVPAGAGWKTVSTPLANANNVPSGSGRLYVTAQSGNVSLDSFTFVGDGLNDVTAPVMTGVWAPGAPTGKNGWYVTAPTLTMSPTDNGSLYSREYSFDGGQTWLQNSYADQFGSGRELGNTLVVNRPGAFTILFRATDTSGNVSNVASLPVKIDLTPPTIHLDGLTDGKVSTPIVLRATDFEPGSGGAQITSVVLDGVAQASLDKLRAAQLTPGQHTVVLKAEDIAGNVSTRAETFTVTGPVQDSDSVTAPGTVGGSVPATLALSIAPVSFGAFTPGITKDYSVKTSATVTSTAGDATLSVSEPGRLTNGAFSLAEPLRVELAKTTWSAPTSSEVVDVTFKQLVKSTDPLRTGSYSKTLTFTLSTTTP